MRVWLLRLVVLVVIGGLGYAGWHWVTSPRASDTPVSEEPFDRACTWPRNYFPDAAAYAGRGPHPVAVVTEEESTNSPSWRLMILTSSNGLRVPRHVNPGSPATVQLVACVDRTGEGEQIDSCRFESSTAPVHRADYTIRLIEARTGTIVGEQSIPDADRVSCPPLLIWDEGDDPTLYADPSARQVLGAVAAIQR